MDDEISTGLDEILTAYVEKLEAEKSGGETKADKKKVEEQEQDILSNIGADVLDQIKAAAEEESESGGESEGA